jgi:hypothetical protein
VRGFAGGAVGGVGGAVWDQTNPSRLTNRQLRGANARTGSACTLNTKIPLLASACIQLATTSISVPSAISTMKRISRPLVTGPGLLHPEG